MNEIQTFVQTNTWIFPILIYLLIIALSMTIYSYTGVLFTCTLMGSLAGAYSIFYIGLWHSLPEWTVVISAPLFVFYFGLAITYLKMTNLKINKLERN
jgi:hypothetical protein